MNTKIIASTVLSIAFMATGAAQAATDWLPVEDGNYIMHESTMEGTEMQEKSMAAPAMDERSKGAIWGFDTDSSR